MLKGMLFYMTNTYQLKGFPIDHITSKGLSLHLSIDSQQNEIMTGLYLMLGLDE